MNASETVDLEIPAGVVDGQRVSVTGKGEAGFRGAHDGDLLVMVRIPPHEYLHREGDDLHARAGVPMTIAALGGEIEVPGLFGPVKIKVHAGAQNGDVVVAKGAGMPTSRGGFGDLVVHVNIVVPKKLTKEQRKLLEQVADSMGEGAGALAAGPRARLARDVGGASTVTLHRFFLTGPLPATRRRRRAHAVRRTTAHHLGRVLRLEPGDRIVVVGSDAREAEATLTHVGPESVRGDVDAAVVRPARPRVSLAAGLARRERMEFAIQKVTELGVVEILPVQTARSVVRLDEDRAGRRGERWRRIAEEAAKQSQRADVPLVRDPVGSTI